MSKLHSQAFLDWLKGAGIIPERTRRVVIEATVNELVKIYIEQVGTDELISVEPPPELCGPQIVVKAKS
jgi:hypothetical protein